MSVGKICDELSSRLAELESEWKEAKETILTPRLATPTSGAPSRQQSFSVFASGVGGREGQRLRSSSPSSTSDALRRPPSTINNIPTSSSTDEKAEGSTRPISSQSRGVSPPLIRSVPASSHRGSALSAARVAKEPSLARTSRSPSGRSVSPSLGALPRNTTSRNGGESVVGRTRNVSPSRPLSPSTAARRFVFEDVRENGTQKSSPPSTDSLPNSRSNNNVVEELPISGSSGAGGIVSAGPTTVSTGRTSGRPRRDGSATSLDANGVTDSRVPNQSVSSGGQRFCHQCGFDLRTCKIPPKFCRECGTRVLSSPAPSLEVF